VNERAASECQRDDGREAGFTLLELIVAITIMGIIILPLTLAMVTGLTTTIDAQQRLSASRSPLFTSAFFSRDAQSAAKGGIDNNPSNPPGCGTGTNVISFTWKTTAPAAVHNYAASYSLHGSGASQTMTRTFCDNGSTSTATLAPVLGSGSPAATATCSPGCSAASLPRTITITVTKPKGGSFTLQATRRTT
jgi:prepilin-type N-terminal cleavage/methylation domain-containing protein